MRLLAVALLAHPPPAAEGQWPGIDHAWALPSAGKWFEWSTGARLLTDSLLGDADALLAARRAAVAELRTEADWARRRADVRGKFAQIFGRSSAEGDYRSTGSCHDANSNKRYVYHNGESVSSNTGASNAGGTFKVKRVGSTVSIWYGSDNVGGGDSQGTAPMNFWVGGQMHDCGFTEIQQESR